MSTNTDNINTAKAAVDDAWDDSLLIKAYDDSIKLSREELARRIASTTSRVLPHSRPKSNDILSTQISASQVATSISNATHTSDYKIGDYCRATYIEDGADYEAKIISINNHDGTCLLKFIGYENEQDVPLTSIVPSWGKKARRLQFAKAKLAEQTGGSYNLPKREKNVKKHKLFNCNFNIPPPPPLPPMLHAVNNTDDSEHLSAMLMSWYMSGYYTGVYHGMQMAKAPTKAEK